MIDPATFLKVVNLIFNLFKNSLINLKIYYLFSIFSINLIMVPDIHKNCLLRFIISKIKNYSYAIGYRKTP